MEGTRSQSTSPKGMSTKVSDLENDATEEDYTSTIQSQLKNLQAGLSFQGANANTEMMRALNDHKVKKDQ